MSKQQFEGRSAAEAAIKACEALGVTRSELKHTVVSDTGEGLARKVTIEVEATPRPAAPAPARYEADAESPDDNRGNSAYGADMGAARPERGGRGGRGRSERRPSHEGQESSGRGGRGGRGNDQGERGNYKRPEGNGHEASSSRAAPERAERPDRPERSDRSERPRRGERDQGRRRTGEGRPPRQREHQERGHQEGIDSLLTIKAAQPGDARHPAIAATSPRSSRALTVVAKLLELMGMQADAVLVSENEAEVHVHLYGTDEARIIGKKGEVLLALQFILNRILSRQEDEGEQVVVLDAGGYRERRQKALEELAKT